MKKLIQSLIIVILTVSTPLIGAPQLMLSWPSVVMFFIGYGLLVTQPALPTREEAKSLFNQDKNTHLMLIGTAIISYQIGLVQFAYFQDYSVFSTPLIQYFGLALVIFSFIYRYRVIKYLGKQFTAQVQIIENHKLITDGPYKRIRHPSYTAAFINFTGTALMLKSDWALLFCLIVVFPVQTLRIKLEEDTLRRAFGSEYLAYMRKTYRMFPFIY